MDYTGKNWKSQVFQMKFLTNFRNNLIDIINEIVYNTCEVMRMDIGTKIRLAETYSKISDAELARRTNRSPQNFRQRMVTGKFTIEEMNEIAEAMNAKYVCYIEFPDGTKF